MSIEETRAALRSAARTVLVEAPAGCGKTHEAAKLAVDMGKGLEPGRDVLLLAHTNAAIQEFKSRISGSGSRVRAMTIDSFALELVAPYAALLGLPSPLSVGPPDGVAFGLLAPKLGELLRRAPAIARALAVHYPVVVLDEHQDARVDQHEVVRLIRGAGASRVRVFGDPLQAIFEDQGGVGFVQWAALLAESDAQVRLSEPQRWRESPELGKWILEGRRRLEGGDPVEIRGAPVSVTYEVVKGLRDPTYANVKAPVREVVTALNKALKTMGGTLGVPARTNAHVRGLRGASNRQLTIHEGADLKSVGSAIREVRSKEGDPRGMALAILSLLGDTCTGLTKANEKAVKDALKKKGIDIGKRKTVKGLVEILGQLYVVPTLRTWCGVIRSVLRDPPEWLKIDLRGILRVIARLSESEDPLAAFEHVVRASKEATSIPARCASTIHKAKGRDFDSVVLPFCGTRTFPEDDAGRKLLYVALSRARRRLHLLLPDAEQSRLLLAP